MTALACPGCVAADAPSVATKARAPSQGAVELYLPGIHCGGCIAGVERTLRAIPGVAAARVNLTRKRVLVTAEVPDPPLWIDRLARAGFEAHETGSAARTPPGEDLILPLGVAGFAMMNVMLLSVAVWSGADAATRDMMHWISAAIALPATAFAARPFFRAALAALARGRLVMDTPISLAIGLACGLSLYETMEGGAEAYFDAALSLTFFLLAGRVLDQRMRRAVRSAASDLAALEPARVTRIEGETRVSRPLAEIASGDALWLAAGARVPVDGVLAGTGARVDRSALTGESEPLDLAPGATVSAGDVLLTGPVVVTACAVGEDTTLRRMARLVAMAETARGRYAGLAERAAAIYTPAVHVIAAATFAVWLWLTGDVRTALGVAIATLIITCPCALGLAVPAVSAAATGALYRMGALVKSETGLERLAEVDTVIFDKTGTLTRQSLILPETLDGPARAVLAGLTRASDHPLARALAQDMQGVTAAPLDQPREIAGEGIVARSGGVDVSLMADPDGGGSILRLSAKTHVLARRETPVEGAHVLVERLRARGFAVGLLSGDAEDRARRVADTLGIGRVWAGVDPSGKSEVLAQLEAEGARVLMVGDGLNDAAALASAHASIAPGGALDISRNAADVVLTASVACVADVIARARAARARMVENLLIAAAYNSVAIPIAVTGHASPLMAAIAMSSSSILVTLNALRVGR